MRCTTLESDSAPSQSDAHVCRRSWTRKLWRPIAAVAVVQRTDRFQFDSLNGPPIGALNSQAPPGPRRDDG